MNDSDGVMNAPYAMLQALTESSFQAVKLLALWNTGTRITKSLGFPADPLDALARFELGKQNYILSAGPKGGRMVLLQHCPFQAALDRMSSWSEGAMHLVKGFNLSPRGGAALHPICICHLSVREAYRGINLGCRSKTSGKIAVSVTGLLDEAGISETRVRALLDGNACLYWLPT